jgi:hypothetical protein
MEQEWPRGQAEVGKMSRSWARGLAAVCLVTAALFLSSCEYFFHPDGSNGPTPLVPPDQGSSAENAEPLDPASDPFPLFLGAHWVYRDATPDIDPEVQAGPRIETDVLGTVRRVDPNSGVSSDCYILRTRKIGAPDVLSYVHRASDGVDLHGVEIVPYTGAPELVQVSGEQYMPLPLARDLAWGFANPYGATLQAEVIGQERVPFPDPQLGFLGPYIGSFANAWRVSWRYGGPLSDAYGFGDVDTWLAPGVGMAGRSAESRYYALMEFRDRNEVVFLPSDFRHAPYPHADEDDVGMYNHTPKPGNAIAVQFRGEDERASSGWRWEIEAACWDTLLAEGVLSPLWVGDQRGDFLPDSRGAQKLDTGSYVFLFKARTAGNAELRFRRVGVGASAGLADEFVFTFGAAQPISLSNGAATCVPTSVGATVTFTVHYRDDDGVAPTVRQVVVYKMGQSPEEGTTFHMTWASGKLADGDYTYTTKPDEQLSLWTNYWYQFHFENPGENGVKEEKDLGPEPLFVGGP